SMNSFFWTSATELKDSGRSFRYLGNSPSRSRVVVRRPPPSKPIMPSPPFSAVDRAMEIWAPPVSDLAVSARVLAGARATADTLGSSGVQVSSRTASRSEEHTSELQSRENLVCRLLLEKKKT